MRFRCVDLGVERLNRRELHQLVLLIPGPKEPTFDQLKGMFEPLRRELARYGPTLPGVPLHWRGQHHMRLALLS